jgi:hypothetical protein
MNSGDWIQAATLVSVAVALLLNVRQNREIARQTKEMNRQNTVVLGSLQQSAYHAMLTQPTALRVSFLKDNPALLEWHMTGRGYPPGTYEQNLRRLYIMLKLETHEMCFISHIDGLLTDEVWTGWSNVVRTDLADVEFQETWALARNFYAPSFVAFVDGLITEIGRPGELRSVA